MWWYDPTYLILIPAFIFAFIADTMVKSRFKKYSNVRSERGITAYDAARAILDANGLYNVPIEHISGELTDHYDPTSNTVRLSDSVYGSSSIAAIGVAAHECGHAIQYAEEYSPMKVRAAIIPITKKENALAKIPISLPPSDDHLLT